MMVLNPFLVAPSGITANAFASPTARNGSAYPSSFISASGGTPPYTYSIVSGALPAGLTLNSSTGVISGTPSGTGLSSGIVARVTDAALNTDDTDPFAIDVLPFVGVWGELARTSTVVGGKLLITGLNLFQLSAIRVLHSGTNFASSGVQPRIVLPDGAVVHEYGVRHTTSNAGTFATQFSQTAAFGALEAGNFYDNTAAKTAASVATLPVFNQGANDQMLFHQSTGIVGSNNVSNTFGVVHKRVNANIQSITLEANVNITSGTLIVLGLQ